MGILLNFLSSLDLLQLSFITLFMGIFFIVFDLFSSLVTSLRFIGKFFSSSTLAKKWSGKLIGSLFVVSLALAANNWAVYILSVVVIATLVTELEFLLWALALLGNRAEVAKTMVGIQGQENAPVRSDMGEILKLIEQLEEQGKKLEEAESQKKFSSLTEYFYDTYARIFGSQIEMLRMIASMPEKKVSRAYADNFFKSTPWVNQITFHSYTSFLFARMLIRYEETTDMFVLTDVGQTFLAFWEHKGLNSIQKLPF